jgi:NADPH:quinone reductase-like Zn-dependent oxidoreductase
VFGWMRLRQPVLGVEFTGTVVETGQFVSRFMPGDPVICMPGTRFGGHAEYALMHEDGRMILRPSGMHLETAAALSFGGTTARDFLRRGRVIAGESMPGNK